LTSMESWACVKWATPSFAVGHGSIRAPEAEPLAIPP
jgi:hypothetical protein